MTPLIKPHGGGNGNRNQGGDKAIESEPIMTWGDVASTPLVLGSGTAVDGHALSASDWEPTRPASLTVGAEVGGISAGPAFDVVDDTDRETMARRAEQGLSNRAKTYHAAGSNGSRKGVREKDDDSVCSSRSKSSMSAASFDRSASLTPAARALLEASNKAHQSKRKSISRSRSASSSRIFQTSSNASYSSTAARIHAGSKASFGSALRMSYTPSATPMSREGNRKRKTSSSSSSLRQAAGGATPRCHSLRSDRSNLG
mmetsp:Transcript_34324/g.72212  ORF Transcript_34324/g.72212 Transcript_34324/m.72212 type:complete len:258 (-) Transcript_34324:286-1059(-)